MQCSGESKQQVLILVGIPASGKSRFAENYKFEDNRPVSIIERDILREELFNCTRSEYKFTKAREKEVTRVRDLYLEERLQFGHNVIIADTNINTKTRINLKAKLIEIATQHSLDFDVSEVTLNVPLATCMKRNRKRQHTVPDSVLIRMQRDLRKLQGKYVHNIKNPDRLPECVLVDIDGTVANHKGIRHPYEWDKVYLDRRRDLIANYVERLLQDYMANYGRTPKVIFMSGRDSRCAHLTVNWLIDNISCVSSNTVELYMRSYNDNRPDTEIKEELFDNYIKGRYHVTHIIDDRQCMVQHWQSMGFDVFDVGNGVSDF